MTSNEATRPQDEASRLHPAPDTLVDATPPDERTPLVSKPDQQDAPASSRAAVARELLFLLKTSVPVILAYTLQNSLQTASVLVVGRLSPEALAVAAFAYMFAMATGWLVALGGTTAIDTLASVSFTGSKNPHNLGVILQRALVVLLAFYLPIVVVWFASEPLFLALGQEPWLARDASRFLMVLAPGGLGYVYFEAMKKYLQAQGMMRPGTYVLLLTSPLNALLNYLLVHALGLGLLGAPLATGISYWLSFLLLALHAHRQHRRARRAGAPTAWGGLSRAALSPCHLATFARLALAGIVHVGTEWWAFEILALVAGRLGTVSLAAQSIIMTTDQILNTVPFGIGVAASARVGNLLGARQGPAARTAAHAAAGLAVAAGAVVGVVLFAVRDRYARLFNDDDERVVRLVSSVMPYVALFQIADGLVGSYGGSLRGMGRQYIGAVVNVVCYYALALPAGIWLAFHGWGLAGLWAGNCGALYLIGIIEWIICAVTDWDAEVREAHARMDTAETGQDQDEEHVRNV